MSFTQYVCLKIILINSSIYIFYRIYSLKWVANPVFRYRRKHENTIRYRTILINIQSYNVRYIDGPNLGTPREFLKQLTIHRDVISERYSFA